MSRTVRDKDGKLIRTELRLSDFGTEVEMPNPLQILLYRDGNYAPGEWIAAALDMDLRGHGDTEDEALTDLKDLVEAQVSFASFKNEPSLITFQAEKKYFDLYEQGRLLEAHGFTNWIVRWVDRVHERVAP